MKRFGMAAIIASLVAGCEKPPNVPVEVSEVAVYAPLPGSKMSAAYFVLYNNSDEPITARRFSSPQFASVELHETTTKDGVARMLRLQELVVPAGSFVALREGGKHLMLIGADDSLGLGSTVSISIGYNETGRLIINAPLRARFELDEAH